MGESEPVDEAVIKAPVKSRDYGFVSLEGENCFLKGIRIALQGMNGDIIRVFRNMHI